LVAEGCDRAAVAAAADLRRQSFPAGSMGPKVDTACGFVEATGKPAMIGSQADAADLLKGNRGTMVTS
jgi:carbamate kinase